MSKQSLYSDPGDKSQKVVDTRRRIARELRNTTPENFKLSERELRLLLHMRSLGWGSLTITIVNGEPAKAIQAESAIDYTKAIEFDT